MLCSSLTWSCLEEYDTYIAVSFTNATLVLSIGETVEEVTDSGFLGTTPTLACSRLGDDALIQVSFVFCAGFTGLYEGGMIWKKGGGQ